MGWWRSGLNPDNVLGDGPADALEDELARLAQIADPKPSFQTLLTHLAAVLRRDADSLLAEPKVYGNQPLVARFQPPSPELVSETDASNPQVLAALTAAMTRISGEYQLELSRKPTLGEMLGTVAFVLRVRPERYLPGTERQVLVDVAIAGDPP